MTDFFKDIPQIKFEGAASDNDFAFRHYDAEEVVMGKKMKDHLRLPGPGAIRLVGQLSSGPGSATRWMRPK